MTQSPFFRIVTAQAIATLLAAASWLVVNRVAALSALMAGVVSILPGIYILLMSRRPVAPGSTGVSNAVRGEAGRFILSAVLFALVFLLVKPLDAVAFFVTFGGLLVIGAVMPLMDARRLLARHDHHTD